MGNLAVYRVFTRLWPVSIAASIDAALDELWRQWERLLGGAGPPRGAVVAGLLARQGQLGEHIALARYEEGIRPASARLAERRLATAGRGRGRAAGLLAVRWAGRCRRRRATAARGRTQPRCAAVGSRRHDDTSGARSDDGLRASVLALIDQRLTAVAPAPAPDDPRNRRFMRRLSFSAASLAFAVASAGACWAGARPPRWNWRRRARPSMGAETTAAGEIVAGAPGRTPERPEAGMGEGDQLPAAAPYTLPANTALANVPPAAALDPAHAYTLPS